MNPPRPVVLDTCIVLDLFVFEDAAVGALKQGVESGAVRWLATSEMRDELVRVLGYPGIVAWLLRRGRNPEQTAIDVLARFDHSARRVDSPTVAPMLCDDADDQPFIDLAFEHGADLISRDRAVIDVWRRLRQL